MKAVGLMSGGLDSALAAKLMSNCGIEIHVIYFRQPWIEKDPEKVRELAQEVGVQFHVIDLGQDYLDMLQDPQYGYGKAFNPCIDCHHFMVKKAGEFMKEIGAQFVFTGEVVGQRPMSQRKQCLPLVEKGTGLEGYLLRPLSAKLLEETIPEKEGWVDRLQLMAISGRSRAEQLRLAKKWKITKFFPTGGGCLITEKVFGARLKDFLSWSYRDPRETAVLKWGRYFRINDQCVAVVGRDRRENDLLEEYAMPDDYFVKLADEPGPLLLLKAAIDPDEHVFALAGGLVQRYSKQRDREPQQVLCIKKSQPENVIALLAEKVDDEKMRLMER